MTEIKRLCTLSDERFGIADPALFEDLRGINFALKDVYCHVHDGTIDVFVKTKPNTEDF